ncbi:MAG: twin-arginine translocation pathway signal, partial [Chthoniobacteraceae bacterium]
MKFASAGTLIALGIPTDKGWTAAAETNAADAWGRTHDRVWLGGEYWANPMEDWRVSDGGAECLSMGGGRSVHSLTHQVTKNGALTMTVTLTRL